MQTYLLSAAGVIFLSVIVSLLIPEGKLNKTITFVMRLICILVLIQPVTGIFKIKDTTESAVNFFDYEFISGEYSKHQSAQLEILLSDKFDAQTECAVEVTYDDGEFLVNGVEVWVSENEGNLIEEIYAYLQELGYINISVYAKSS